ncbi:hypothetical protein L1887_50261 [Cichorium endivia]|nr:hypothetical protein L1887_50261 [Cichorium endivia]
MVAHKAIMIADAATARSGMPSVSKRGKAAGVDAEEPRVARGEGEDGGVAKLEVGSAVWLESLSKPSSSAAASAAAGTRFDAKPGEIRLEFVGGAKNALFRIGSAARTSAALPRNITSSARTA